MFDGLAIIFGWRRSRSTSTFWSQDSPIPAITLLLYRKCQLNNIVSKESRANFCTTCFYLYKRCHSDGTGSSAKRTFGEESRFRPWGGSGFAFVFPRELKRGEGGICALPPICRGLRST